MLVHIVPFCPHCHLLSIFCTFVIEQINDDEMMMMMTTTRPVKCRRTSSNLALTFKPGVDMWPSLRMCIRKLTKSCWKRGSVAKISGPVGNPQASIVTADAWMMYLCKLAHVIRYIVKSQHFHFRCFRAMAFIQAVKLSAVLSILWFYSLIYSLKGLLSTPRQVNSLELIRI